MAKSTKRLTLGAGEEVKIPGVMQFARLIKASGPVSVYVSGEDSQAGYSEGADLVEGRAYRFRSASNGVYVKNDHSAQQTFDIVVALGDIEDNTFNGNVEISRFTTDPQIQGITDNVTTDIATMPDVTIAPGEAVNVGNFPAGFNVNGGALPEIIDRRALTTVCMIGERERTAAAGLFPMIQLHNFDDGSGDTMVVRSAVISSPVNAKVMMGRYDTQATTAGGTGQNKNTSIDGGPKTTAQLRMMDLATLSNPAARSHVAAYGEVEMIKKDPIILNPGYGIYVASYVAASTITASFEWEQI